MDDATGTIEGVKAADPLDANCPTREVLDLVGDRWSLLVLLVLGEGIRRNGALKRRIDGISQKMLTQTLRALEMNGLVTRQDFATVPPHVEYQPTALGASLQGALAPLFRWIDAHFEDVLAAREDREGKGQRAARRPP